LHHGVRLRQFMVNNTLISHSGSLYCVYCSLYNRLIVVALSGSNGYISSLGVALHTLISLYIGDGHISTEVGLGYYLNGRLGFKVSVNVVLMTT